MMVGGGVDEDLGPDEPRPVDEWPPPTSNLELTNKDGSSSRLLFLTVQYVGEEAGASFNTGLDSFSELEQRVVSPLDPNMGCTACYSPVYRSTSPIIPAPGVSPTGGYLTSSSPPPTNSLTESGMIVLSETCQFGATDNYVVTSGGRMYTQDTVSGEDGKLLLLSADPTHSAELVVAGGDACEDQRVELLLSNGTIAYGIVESTDNTGTRVIQIPREYLVTARTQGNNLPNEQSSEQNKNVEDQIGSVQDENGHLRALYNTLKEQGLIIEPGELRLEGELDQSPQLIDTTLLEQTTLPVLGQDINTRAVPASSAPPSQRRFWCEECNVLLDKDCTEHQVNRKISDKAVPSRARATLPASYLAINQLPDKDREEYGVFARKSIPKRTQFGPIEGVIFKSEEVMVVDEISRLELTIETETGEMRILDVSNEHMSNWMRFVRMASPGKPPNLLLSQLGASLFFTTTQAIQPRQELLVWYSPAYAIRRNLPAEPPPFEWPCSTCGKKLKTCDELTTHMSTHKTISKREENLTVNTLRRKNQALVAFVKKDMAEKSSHSMRYECAICNKKFLRGYSLKRHILLIHTRENKYHCKICHLGFSHSYNRLRHMRRAHPVTKDNKAVKTIAHRYESWTCSHCKLTFNSASILNLHTLVHAANDIEGNISPPDDTFHKPQDVIPCPQCSQKFSNKRKLASHVAEHGKNRDATDKKFHCKECGRNFISAIRFQIHCERHEDDEKKPLQCHICLKRVLTKSALSCHLKIHDCSVQWECPMCKQQFSNVLALRSHVHSHAIDDGMYHCPHCEKEFEEYSGIRKHIRAFHSVPKYVCQDCGKRFPTQDKLRMHLLKHSDHREFLCADCGKQFKRKDKLKEHMKRLHSSEIVPDKLPDKKVMSKLVVNASDYERYIYKCHSCMLGFKRRGMLVNHLANRHPDITPESVPELNLPILKTTRDYYCQYCEKVYKSSSKRKAHILKNHPGLELPMSNRQKGGVPDIPGLPNPTFSQTVGSITTTPHGCQWCHKQYASKAKLLQHQRKNHLKYDMCAQGGVPDNPDLPNPTSSQTVGSITTTSHSCQWCHKQYASKAKLLEHQRKNHPKYDMCAQGGVPDIPGLPNPTFSQTVGSITTTPHGCQWCHKQYASKAKLLQHQRKKHVTLMPHTEQIPRPLKNLAPEENIEKSLKPETKPRASKYNDIVGPVPIALSTNLNLNSVALTSGNLNHFQEYEIINGEDDTAENGILIDSQSIIKRESLKNDNISSDLLSQAMSEIGATLSDLRAISSDQYFKLLQEPIYTPYTAR